MSRSRTPWLLSAAFTALVSAVLFLPASTPTQATQQPGTERVVQAPKAPRKKVQKVRTAAPPLTCFTDGDCSPGYRCNGGVCKGPEQPDP